MPIEFTGLREGEKVTEELWEKWERPMATESKRVMVIREANHRRWESLQTSARWKRFWSAKIAMDCSTTFTRCFPSSAPKARPAQITPSVRRPGLARRAASSVSRCAMRIPLSKPDIGEREIEYVTRTLRSGNLSNGSLVNEFEEKFAAYAGTRYAVATNSGTSALHLCVRAIDIGVSDEVITTSFSFVASANCLLYERAMPAFADIDPATLNLDPNHLRELLTREYIYDRANKRHVNRWSGRILKAILPVHIFGLPCDMDPILEMAGEFNLAVLEDACEALGAEYRGRRVGTFGDASVFAFYPNKQMTTAEGGMVATDSPRIAKLCRMMRNQGRDEETQWLRHVRLGYNYRLSNLHCALGLAQLERIDRTPFARERVAALYSQAFSQHSRNRAAIRSTETQSAAGSSM